ncbi:MAG: hypothetical protein N2506_00800 [Dehalococcoidales bacterium]|nr:hypothetical protein [Dehalococcoidales bacterium]
MKKAIFSLLASLLMLAVFFTGCTSGIPKETYDQAVASLQDLQGKYSDLLSRYESLKQEKTQLETQLENARSRVAALEKEVADLKARYELTGATPAETAEKIVRYYHETHVYSSYDLFVCSDMASEVWNMLKAAGVSSIIMVGNRDVAITDIIQSNHAWVLAEIGPGQYLALETTAGYSVPYSQNPLYYRGWTYNNPAGLKAENELRKEYNVRVGILNNLIQELNEAIDRYNRSTSQAEADRYYAVYEKLKELKEQQEADLLDLRGRLESLATPMKM